MFSSYNALSVLKTIVNSTLSEIPHNTDNSCKVVLTQLDATIDALMNKTEDMNIDEENINLKCQLRRALDLKDTYEKDNKELRTKHDVLNSRILQLERGLAVTQENESYQVKIREEFADKLERTEKRYENLRKRHYTLKEELDNAKKLYKELIERYEKHAELFDRKNNELDELLARNKALNTKLEEFKTKETKVNINDQQCQKNEK